MDDAPSPLRFFDAFVAYQRTAALKAAIELDVFTIIGGAGATAPEVAARAGAVERGVRSLCNALVTERLLTKSGDRYGLDPDAAMFLDRSSPVYMGAMIQFITSPTIMEAFARLTEAVRRGGSALGETETTAPDHPVWVEFARSMAGTARLSAALTADLVTQDAPVRGSVLDVAAGHGFFGIAVAERNPEARIVALDWRAVLAVAEENARAAGLADRFTPLPGSAFDVDLGTGHAVVLLPHFLHHFDLPTCERLLRRVHAALAPGGRVVLVEFVPDPDRVSPPEAARFSLTMLATTPAGDAWTLAEYETMLRAAGFGAARMHDLSPTPQRAILAAR